MARVHCLRQKFVTHMVVGSNSREGVLFSIFSTFNLEIGEENSKLKPNNSNLTIMVKQDVVMGILESCPFLWQSLFLLLWNARFLVMFLEYTPTLKKPWFSPFQILLKLPSITKRLEWNWKLSIVARLLSWTVEIHMSTPTACWSNSFQNCFTKKCSSCSINVSTSVFPTYM